MPLVLATACAADVPGPDAVRSPTEPTPATARPAGAPTVTAPASSMTIAPAVTAEPGPLPSATVGDPLVTAEQPVDVVLRPGTSELYVAERLGAVRRIVDGTLGPVELDVSDRVVPAVEEGLLGMAFSPDATRLYLNKASAGRTSVIEYAVAADGGIDPATRREVYGFDQPYDNHNGGELLFGSDGYLYVFTGDGGFVADPQRRALDLTTPKGKVLRIDPTPSEGLPYSVPADNPFVGDAGALDEIWSYGLRNPWRASFDPETGDLWIADVGDFAWEEINVAWADEGGGRGVSFGWSAWEGSSRFNEDQRADGHEFPFFEYPHGDDGCSVTGGERYRGSAIVDLVGWFVFADFCTGVVRALEVTADRAPGRIVELGTVPFPVSISRGVGGELYVVSIEGGIHPIVPA